MTQVEFEYLVDEWTDLSISHANPDDPHVREVCHRLQCECEIEHLRDLHRLP